MTYEIEFRPRALKELRKLSIQDQRRIALKIAALANDLAGDVKKLTNFTPEYRLRVGDYRVLFDIVTRASTALVEKPDQSATNDSGERNGNVIVRVVIVQRILRRKEAYNA